jgi:hypothetical protein
LTVLHGAEHAVSLFFADVAKLKPINGLIDNYRCVYTVFGTGAMHASYALFQKQAKNFNGEKIGLIRAADTRMTGYFMALHCMLRLKNALCATIVSSEYKNIKWTKTSTPTKMEAFIEDKQAWYAIYAGAAVCIPCTSGRAIGSQGYGWYG